MLQETVQRVARSKPKWRFVLLSKQLRVLEELFRKGGYRVRVCGVSGLFTSQEQRAVTHPDPEFTRTIYTTTKVAVDWSRSTWNDAMWLGDFIAQKIDPLNVYDLSVDCFQYMVDGNDLVSLGGRYQLLKLKFMTWSVKPGIFERLRTNSVSMPNLWLYQIFKAEKERMKSAGQLTPETEKRIRDTFLVLSEILPNQPLDVMTDQKVMEELHPKAVALLLHDDEVAVPLRELKQ